MKRGLGRGLDSLFGSMEEESTEKSIEKEVVKVEKVVVNEPKEIEIGLIDRNPDQPRTVFDEEALQELSNSIRTHGVIQPIIVKEDNGRYKNSKKTLYVSRKRVLVYVCDTVTENVAV